MKLRRIEFALVVGDDRNRRARRFRHTAKSVRQFRHAVAVAHPDVMLFADLPHAIEKRAIVGHFNQCAAEFTMMPRLDGAAELVRHRLLTIADAEHGNACVQDRQRRGRRVLVEHRGRPAREYHRLRLHLFECSLGLLIRHDLGIDAILAHAPCNELRHLRAKIDDQNLFMRGSHIGRHGGFLSLGCHDEEIRDQSESRNGARRMARPPSTPNCV